MGVKNEILLVISIASMNTKDLKILTLMGEVFKSVRRKWITPTTLKMEELEAEKIWPLICQISKGIIGEIWLVKTEF